jgi:imidazole glycerol-phosphate synthase subunit HisH
MNVVIVQYNAGNTCSVQFALERIGVAAVITDNPATIAAADKVIFPGVGAAGDAMQYVREKGLDQLIPALKQPVLGVCLGMQLLCAASEEDDTTCLGIFPQQVKKFIGDEKIPHIGWNNILQPVSALYAGVDDNAFMYFVHSYYAETGDHTISATEYMTRFSSALQKDNFYAVQFHPEKSGLAGQRILENFIQL